MFESHKNATKFQNSLTADIFGNKLCFKIDYLEVDYEEINRINR
jgi:hypothetical protein